MGYDLVEGRYGWFNRPASTGRGRGTVRPGVSADDVEALIAEAEEIVGGDSLSLELDDRATRRPSDRHSKRLSSCRGRLPCTSPTSAASNRRGTNPPGCASTTCRPTSRRCMSGRSSSSRPSPTPRRPRRVRTSKRNWSYAGWRWPARVERSPLRLKGESVAVAAFFEGDDRFVFVLGTRFPFRHLGIGRALLTHVVHDPRASDCRSVSINADEGGRPESLYRQLGFTDEVHWRRPWKRSSSGD